MSEIIPVESDEHWHALRAKHIGATESPGLFGLSPYKTRFMIWHEKKNGIVVEPEHERVNWGKILQGAIAAGVSAEMRWQLEAHKTYHVDGHMGCTIDYHIVAHEDGPGIVEVKNVDWLRWKDTWTETNAPPHIEIQLQHQLAVTGYPWGAIAVLVGGNELRIYERKPHPETIAEIRAHVDEFWRSLDGAAPDPFGVAAELKTLQQLCTPPDPKLVCDLTGDLEAFESARVFAWAKEQKSFHENVQTAERVKLLAKIGKAQTIILPGFDFRRNKSGAIIKCEMLPGAVAPVLEPKELMP